MDVKIQRNSLYFFPHKNKGIPFTFPKLGITMVCGHRACGKQVSVFGVGKCYRGGKLIKSR